MDFEKTYPILRLGVMVVFAMTFRYTSKMRGVKKKDLPKKICVVCKRPFRWRKKWAKQWDEVKYCSERCRRRRKQGKDEG